MMEPTVQEVGTIPDEMEYVDIYIPIARWANSNIWASFSICNSREDAKRALAQSSGYEDHKILIHHEVMRKTESIIP